LARARSSASSASSTTFADTSWPRALAWNSACRAGAVMNVDAPLRVLL
jgi:hypothetical protein